MKPITLGIILVAIGGLLVIGVIIAFGLFFHSYEISNNVNDWGAFGSYLSGAIGAPISILALIGAVVALYQQHKTDKKASDQYVALEIVKSIERLEETLDNALIKLTIGINYPDLEMSIETDAYRILNDVYAQEVLDKLIPKYNSDPNVIIEETIRLELSGKEKLEQLRFIEIYVSTTGKLKFMRSLLEQHKDLTGHNIVAIYYKNKYKNAVSKLAKAGYPIELWDDVEKIEKAN